MKLLGPEPSKFFFFQFSQKSDQSVKIAQGHKSYHFLPRAVETGNGIILPADGGNKSRLD